MPYLAKILLYPIKSLDGIEVTEAKLLSGGALAHDREFALFDRQGAVVNAKRIAKIQTVRSTYDLTARTVGLRLQDSDQAEALFHLDHDRDALSAWFSDYLEESVTLRQNLEMGFPDDTDAAGPTVVSVATLETVASWFPDLQVEDMRQRFRTNLEIDGVPAFWEDHQFGAVGQAMPFQIGAVELLGNNPCQRCVVPTRNPLTGDRYPNFQKTFVAQRQISLPDRVEASRFNHFYKLTLNTRVPATETGKILRVGDAIQW